MNWEVITAIAEWVGALFVGFSLIYLAVQIRQQNRVSQYSAWQSIIDGMNQQLVNSTPESIAAYLKGRNEPSECDQAEMFRFQNAFRIYFNNTHKAYRAFKSGFLSEDEWTTLASVFAAELHTPGGRLWRQGNEGTSREFFDAVDRVSDEVTAALDLKP